MSVRVAIIEDVAPFASTLEKSLHASDAGIECIGIFPRAEEALERLPRNPPDVAIVDINLPGMSGIELIARLREKLPAVLCLVLTTYEEPSLIFEALRAGACGYLLKRAPVEEITSAILQAHQGGSPMSPQIARQVVSFFHRQPVSKGIETLSDREEDVLRLLSEGAMYKEIANQLGISLDTVRSHVRKIYEKLHVHSRHEAVRKYMGG